MSSSAGKGTRRAAIDRRPRICRACLHRLRRGARLAGAARGVRAALGADVLAASASRCSSTASTARSRAVRVAELLPRWSGDVLDLVVDFITYVFVPAYAIAASGLLPQVLAIPAALRDRDHRRALFRRPRHEDRRTITSAAFRRCGTLSAFYLLLLRPAPWLAAAAIVVLAVLTFVPFRSCIRSGCGACARVTLALLALWAVLAAVALFDDLEPGPWVTAALVRHRASISSASGCCRREMDDAMLDLLIDPHAWAALVTLTALEIVLGIDNVVFISVLVSRCSPQQAKRARQIGLSLALRLPHHHAVRPDLADEADRSRCSRSSASASPGATSS